MLLSVMFTRGWEISFLPCGKRTAGFCFTFFMKEHENGSTYFVWRFFPCEKCDFFQLTDALTNKPQEIQAWNFVCEYFTQLSYVWKNKSLFSIRTHSLSTNTFCTWGTEMSPLESCSNMARCQFRTGSRHGLTVRRYAGKQTDLA